jgi:hypothetical protein
MYSKIINVQNFILFKYVIYKSYWRSHLLVLAPFQYSLLYFEWQSPQQYARHYSVKISTPCAPLATPLFLLAELMPGWIEPAASERWSAAAELYLGQIYCKTAVRGKVCCAQPYRQKGSLTHSLADAKSTHKNPFNDVLLRCRILECIVK